MAQEGFDTLMALTDSRYRLSMIVAQRAAQLKLGIPSVLPTDAYPKTRNTVTVAMKELEYGQGLRWGNDLPSAEELKQLVERERRQEPSTHSMLRSEGEDEFDEEDEAVD
ncbi:MAG: DNA-directed RNA polymerase subunit omega [Truepera sp.]|nr:DNA-directed RNA polymerase subunit omega [Truepera sp.]